MSNLKGFDLIIDILRKMGRFTLIPNAGCLDQSVLMESIYTFLDKAKLPYIIKKIPDETDEQIVFCGTNIEQVKTLLSNKNIKQVVFLPNRYSDERLSTLLDERCILFCHDTESFNFMKKNSVKAKVYLSDNLAFLMKLKTLKCPDKEANKIPLGKRYLIWHLASIFKSKMKQLRLGKNFYSVGYFFKDSTLPNAVDVAECYQGNFVYRPLTKWLAVLFVGIIKAPDIIVTNIFSVALIAEQLGKTVFIIQDDYGQRIRYTKLGESTHVFSLSPQQNVECNMRSILQTVYCTKNGNLKPFQKMNPIPEADIKLKAFHMKTKSRHSIMNIFSFVHKVVHLVFITDENYAMMTGVAIQSAIENKNRNTFYDINVLGYHLSDFSFQGFKALENKKVRINVRNIANLDKFKKIKQNRYITTTALLKFDLPVLFDKLDKVLYLDGDVFVQGDLWEFYNKNIRHNYAAVIKAAVLLTPQIHKEQSVCKNDNYFNSGVLLLNLKKMRQDNIPEKLLEWRLHHGAYFMDQDALNAVLSPNVKLLNCWYNFLSHYPFIYSSIKLSTFYQTKVPHDFLSSYKKALILHYAGKKKPYSINMPYLTNEFMRYLEKTQFRILLRRKQSGKGDSLYSIGEPMPILTNSAISEDFTLIYSKRFSGLTEKEIRFCLEKQFKSKVGYPLNLDNPQTFNEKIQWLKLYYHDPLMTKYADKVTVRDYIKEKIGEEYLIPCLGIWDNPEDIDFNKLPEQFVLKINWGSGQNIIVKDKSKLDIVKVKQQLAKWMEPKNNHYFNFFEWSYKNISPKIIAEKYIEQMDGKLLDWKFFCFSGKAKFVQVDIDRRTNHKRCFYDMDYNKQEFTTYYPLYRGEVEKPVNFHKMKEIAEILSSNFPFVRVDMFCVNGLIKLGELTFYHGNGTECFMPEKYDKILGNYLKLPMLPFENKENKCNYVTVYHDEVYSYPPKETLFRPSVKYPEYNFEDLSLEDNKVYDMVRETFRLMEMDIENFGTKIWNPLKDIVKPGDNVLIKPNMVLHKNDTGEGEDCLYTSPAVVAAVVDYVLIALEGNGKVVIGDAPLQECIFDELIKNSGYESMVKYYQDKGHDVNLVDFRNVKTYVGKDGLHYVQNDALTNKDEGIVVQLNEISSFTGLSENHLKNMRITNYDPRILQKHHSVSKHEYKVSKYILDADVIINIPKPKTHRKAGITAALKNLVGINANKEYLPHHTLGSKEEGGDAYLHKNESLTKANEILDQLNIFNADGKIKEAREAWKEYSILRNQGVNESKEQYWEGSWYGNDTIGRTIFDLNKILFYADKQGKIQNQKQRRYFIVGDMIVSGEKEGPLTPSRKPCGILVMGYDPACFDRVIASIMGFDYHLLPSINEVLNRKGGICEITSGEQPKLLTNVKQWQGKDLDEIQHKSSLHFCPSKGWKGVL